MATPAASLTFKLIEGELPSYGARYSDVTRPGDTTARFLYEGHRGGRAQLRARRYFVRQSDANAFGRQCQSLQGSAVWLIDQLNSRSIAVFLHAVTLAPLQRINSSDGSKYAVIATIDVQRTA